MRTRTTKRHGPPVDDSGGGNTHTPRSFSYLVPFSSFPEGSNSGTDCRQAAIFSLRRGGKFFFCLRRFRGFSQFKRRKRRRQVRVVSARCAPVAQVTRHHLPFPSSAATAPWPGAGGRARYPLSLSSSLPPPLFRLSVIPLRFRPFPASSAAATCDVFIVTKGD